MTVEPDGMGTVVYNILQDVAQESYVSNSMSASFGIFAFDYILSRGTMVATFNGNAVSGTVDVIGTSRNSFIEENYVAQFGGVLVETFEFLI